ncbi:MAG: hypothetical protein JNM07_09300 [Phycisphaerae bacterium]|nr:hypothetical protein [Phycisphaerae bacterium]
MTVWRRVASGIGAGVVSGLVLLGAAGCATSDRAGAPRAAPAATPLTSEAVARNIESFDVVWQTVRDKHWDPTLGGVDWEKARAELRPKVEAARTQPEARAAMSELLLRLNQSHFGIIPSELYASAPAELDTPGAEAASGAAASGASPAPSADPGSSRSGSPGLWVRVLDHRPVVTRVLPGSPAAAAGVKPGWVLTRLKGMDAEKMVRDAESAESFTGSPLFHRAQAAMMMQSLLAGAPGSTVKTTFLDGSDREVQVELGRAELGTPANFSNLPTLMLVMDSRMLPGDVYYFGFSIFFDPPRLMDAVGKAVNAARQARDGQGARGMIIDLRGNPGGIGALAMGIGGYLTEQPNQKLGTMKTRTSNLNFVLNPRVDRFNGPVAVLVDELSMSTAEILAGGLKDLGRARVFGTPTPGAALPSIIAKLPNGDRFQYAMANYISVGGEPLEGKGVVPDEEVLLSRASLMSGGITGDPAIDAALRWVNSQRTANNEPVADVAWSHARP